MAGKGVVARLLSQHRTMLLRDLDVNRILPRLMRRGVFSTAEEKEIMIVADPSRRVETFLDVLSRKGLTAFREFCQALEDFTPHILTEFLLDIPGKCDNFPLSSLFLLTGKDFYWDVSFIRVFTGVIPLIVYIEVSTSWVKFAPCTWLLRTLQISCLCSSAPTKQTMGSVSMETAVLIDVPRMILK